MSEEQRGISQDARHPTPRVTADQLQGRGVSQPAETSNELQILSH